VCRLDKKLVVELAVLRKIQSVCKFRVEDGWDLSYPEKNGKVSPLRYRSFGHSVIFALSNWTGLNLFLFACPLTFFPSPSLAHFRVSTVPEIRLHTDIYKEGSIITGAAMDTVYYSQSGHVSDCINWRTTIVCLFLC